MIFPLRDKSNGVTPLNSRFLTTKAANFKHLTMQFEITPQICLQKHL